LETCNFIAEETISPTFEPTMVLLRSVFFIKEEKSQYVTIRFYPAHSYQVLVEFGGPRSKPITLTEQHASTMAEHLTRICEAMCANEHYS
jgi:hypothetical protein